MQEEAFDLADKVVVFNRGRIEQVGTPEEIKSNPSSPFVMDFVGDVASVTAKSLVITFCFVFSSFFCVLVGEEIGVPY